MEEPDISDTASSGQDQEEVSQAFAARVSLRTYASTLLERWHDSLQRKHLSWASRHQSLN